MSTYHHHHHHTKHNTSDKIQETVLTFADGSAGTQTTSVYYTLQVVASISGAALGRSAARKIRR